MLKIIMQSLFGIAIVNLTNRLNKKVELYKVNPDKGLKHEIVEMMMDRRSIYMCNKDIIGKYL